VLTSRGMIARRYQDLICWQLARELEQLVFELTATGPVAKDFKFRDQIRDSSAPALDLASDTFPWKTLTECSASRHDQEKPRRD